jgi:hypothetical protein
MEAAVAIWLILGVAPRLLRLAAIAYFGLLAAVSLWLGIRGVPSCGCFGAVVVNPWITFGIDIVAIIALAWARPREARDIAPMLSKPFLMRTLTLALGASAVVAVFAVTAVAQYGSVTTALVALRAEALSVEPPIADIGNGPAGERLTVRLTVVNRGDRPVRLVGGKSDCKCIVTDDLPQVVPAGESRTVNARVLLPRVPGEFRHKYIFNTDDPGQPVVAGMIVAHVAEAQRE